MKLQAKDLDILDCVVRKRADIYRKTHIETEAVPSTETGNCSSGTGMQCFGMGEWENADLDLSMHASHPTTVAVEQWSKREAERG